MDSFRGAKSLLLAAPVAAEDGAEFTEEDPRLLRDGDTSAEADPEIAWCDADRGGARRNPVADAELPNPISGADAAIVVEPSASAGSTFTGMFPPPATMAIGSSLLSVGSPDVEDGVGAAYQSGWL